MISRPGLRRTLAGLAVALLLTSCDSGGAATPTEPESSGSSGPSGSGGSGGSGGSESSSPSLPTATSTAPSPSTPDGSVYVALGDSFVSAPLVPKTNMRNGCLRSDHNYPHLLVEELDGFELVDVSCSGASTPVMTQPQVVGGVQHSPQFDALSEEVDLVTIGIGANDFSLFGLLVYRCINLASSDRAGAPCRAAYDDGGTDRLLSQIEQIEDRIEVVVTEIGERAPDARVVMVTYPQLLPTYGVCPDRMPLAKGDYAYLREINLALVEAQVAGAEAGGAEVLDVYAESKGHDICSDEPWVNGIDTDPTRALAFHPFPEEQRAVADLLVELVEG